MSLLLEALKKAEKAKEEAQRKAGEPAAPADGQAMTPRPQAPRAELSLEPSAAESKHVVTRTELPDIHQPLEILSDDLSPSARPPSESRGAPAAKSRPATSRPATAKEAPATESARAGARKVFEAKHREPNPRLPFFITLGALGVAAVGIVVYFWIQLRPPQMLVNPNPTPTAAGVASAPASAAQPASSAPSSTPSSSGQIAGLPGVPSAARPAPVPAPAAPAAAPPRGPKPAAIPEDPAPRLAARPARTAPAAEPAQAPQLQIARPTPQLHPQVEAAYAAYQSGNLGAARNGYEAALRDEPGNRDALLGLAAVDARSGRLDAAEAVYVRLLRADPRDAHAQAGLLGVRGARVDPLAAESRVKTLLATDPGAHVLHFALGNQLAQQGRWAEAQQHYFRAYSAEPEQPDFAFNLAVSLEHMRQPRLARQYYERAVTLAGKRSASFDVKTARERVLQLPE